MSGNTEGVLVNQPRPAIPGANTNPPASKGDDLEKRKATGHVVLDALGAIPVVGSIFDTIHGAIYSAEGDKANAAISFGTAALDLVPGAGAVAKVVKYAAKGAKSIGKGAAKLAGKGAAKAAEKAAESTAEKAAARAATGAAEKSAEKSAEKMPVFTDEASKQDALKRAREMDAGKDDGIAITDKKKGEAPKVCPGVGHPVNPVLGIKFLAGEKDLDFALPAALPLRWQRSYFSDQQGNGWLGQGWSLPFSARLSRDAEVVLLIDGEGRETELPRLEAGQRRFARHDALFVSREANGRYRITTVDERVRYVFAPLALGEADRQGATAPLLPLIAIEDGNGNRIRLLYDEAGLPAELHDAAGRILDLRFSTVGLPDGTVARRLQSVARRLEPTADLQTLVTYRYSPAGDLVGVLDGHGKVRREFRYVEHMLTEHSEPGGLVARYEYDAYTTKGKVVRHTTSLGQTWLFDYGEGETRVTDPLQRVTRYQFTPDQHLTGIVDANGRGMERTVDGLGRPISIMQPGGRETTFSYGSKGDIASSTDPAGHRSSVRYDAKHRPVALTDVMGQTTQYEYDDAGNVVRIVDPLGQTTEFTRDARGLATTVTDSDGKARHFEYDRAGLAIAFTDCSGFTTHLARDASGRVTTATYPDGTQTTLQYDTEGKLLAVVHPDGASEHRLYDALGRQIGQRDALGEETSWELDVDGLPLSHTNACGGRFLYHYDAARRLVGLSNENGAHYRLAYDEHDNVISQQDFDGVLIGYRYDDAGQLVERRELGTQTDGVEAAGIAAAGIMTVFVRDASGRVIEKIARNEVDGASTHSHYRYDAAGSLIHAHNAHSSVDRHYDRLGRLVTEVCEASGQRHVLRHAYNGNGTRSETVLPDGTHLNYLYYGPGYLHQIGVDGDVLCDIERDDMHREISRTQGALTSRYRYDLVGQLLDQQAFPVTPAAHFNPPAVSRHYQYDDAGNLLGIDDPYSGATRHRYDPLGRLIQSGNEHFAFDPAHNLIDPGTTSGNSKATPNHLTQYRNHRYTYDVYGNLIEKITDGQRRLGLYYTPEHRLDYIETGTGDQYESTRYGYDALGRRIFKETPGGTTHFLWDGDRLLSEITADRTITWLYEPDSFVPLAQIVRQDATDKRLYYYHTDQVGTPRELTSPDGEVIWRARYEAWGNIARETALIHQPLRFQGQYHDEESGLHYSRYRYYDPDIGRFVTPDPIGLAGGHNAYMYAPNPTGWIDPLGLQKEFTGYVYRALTENQWFDSLLGRPLTAKNPDANVSHKKHVGGPVTPGGDHMGGKDQATQFLSTSKSLERACLYDGGKQQVVAIDLSKIPDERIKDISSGHGLKGTARMWAREDQEVLITGPIPHEAYELLNFAPPAPPPVTPMAWE